MIMDCLIKTNGWLKNLVGAAKNGQDVPRSFSFSIQLLYVCLFVFWMGLGLLPNLNHITNNVQTLGKRRDAPNFSMPAGAAGFKVCPSPPFRLSAKIFFRSARHRHRVNNHNTTFNLQSIIVKRVRKIEYSIVSYHDSSTSFLSYASL